MSDARANPQLVAFEQMLDGKGYPRGWYVRALLQAMFSPIKAVIVYTPGVGGYGLRREYYRRRFGHYGKNSLVDVGVIITGEENVSIGDCVWIDGYCSIEAIKASFKLVGGFT